METKQRKSKRVGTFSIYLMYTLSPDIITTGSGFYIGYTGCKVEDRVKYHIQEASAKSKAKKYTKKLNWLRSLCEGMISYVILEEGIKTEEDAWDREVHYIKLAKEGKLKDILKNGDNGGKGKSRITDELKENYVKAIKGNSWNKGRKYTGKILEEYHLRNIGRKWTKESIEKRITTYKENVKKKESIGIYRSQIVKKKYTIEQVIEMFRLINEEYKNIKDIASMYNCPYNTIYDIIRKKNTYKDYKAVCVLQENRRENSSTYKVEQSDVATGIEYAKQFENRQQTNP